MQDAHIILGASLITALFIASVREASVFLVRDFQLAYSPMLVSYSFKGKVQSTCTSA